MAKKPTGEPKAKQEKKEEKVILPRSLKSLRDARILIVWFIVIAFVLTSGVMIVGLGSGRGRTNDDPTSNGTAPLTAEDIAKQRFAADLRYAQEQLAKSPNDPMLHSRLGDTYMDMENFEQAIASYKKALELDPGYVPTYRHLASAYAAQKKYDDAAKTIEQAIVKGPDDTKNYDMAANIYYVQKNYPKTEAMLRKAIEKDQGELNFYMALAMILKEQNKKEDARKVLTSGRDVAKNRNKPEAVASFEMLIKDLDKPATDALTVTDGKPEERKVRPSGAPVQVTIPQGSAVPVTVPPAGGGSSAAPATTAPATTTAPAAASPAAPTAQPASPAPAATK